MKSNFVKFFKKIVFEFSFSLFSLLVFFLVSNRNIQNDSVTYTRTQQAATTIRSIQTILIPSCLSGFTNTRNQVLQEIINHFRKLLKVIRQRSNQTMINIVGCLFFIYCLNLLIITVNTKITITERLYSIVCYTGQKIIELYIVVSIRHLQESILRNYSGSSLISRPSCK